MNRDAESGEDRALPQTRSSERRPPRKITGVRILTVLGVGALLYFAHVAFVPLALAALFALVLSGPVELLRCVGVPRGVSAALIMLVILGLVVGMADLLSEPAQHWFAEAPHTVRVIARKIRPVAQFISRIDELRSSAGNIGAASHAPQSQPAASAPQESAPALLFDVTLGVGISTLTVLILTLFLLAGGPPMLARMTSALVSDLKSAHVIDLIDKVRREVGRFYVTTALINVGLALATGCAMMWCGMPNPFLWGTVAGVLNFIPYAGPTTTLVLLSSVAFVSFDGFAHVAAVAGSFLALDRPRGSGGAAAPGRSTPAAQSHAGFPGLVVRRHVLGHRRNRAGHAHLGRPESACTAFRSREAAGAVPESPSRQRRRCASRQPADAEPQLAPLKPARDRRSI